MVFLTIFKANESSSSSCYLTFPQNSFQLRWLFIFPSVAGPGFDPGKAELYLKLCFFDVYPLFKSKFMFDILQCKAEGFFFSCQDCVFPILLGSTSGLPAPPYNPHSTCSAQFFENNKLNTYLYISADFHSYNITKAKKLIFLRLQLFISLK